MKPTSGNSLQQVENALAKLPPNETLSSNQLLVPLEADAEDIVKALVMAAYDTSPVIPHNNLDGYQTTLPEYLATELLAKSPHDHATDLCRLTTAYGRDVGIVVRMDREGVLGLYNASTGLPVAAERAGRIFSTAVDIYEAILAEKDADQSRSQEPLPEQLQSVLGQIDELFAGVEPTITLKDWAAANTTTTSAPSLGAVTAFLRGISGWEKVENPKHPHSLRYTYQNGDYIIVDVADDKEYPGLTAHYTVTTSKFRPEPQMLLDLYASLYADRRYPSNLHLETQGGHLLTYQTEAVGND